MDIQLQVGVKVLLKNQDGKYLLLHRIQEKYPDITNLWDIIGGRITPGTPLIENLRREIREEVKLDLVDAPKLIAAQDILKVPGKHVVRLTYIGSIRGDVQLDPEEHDTFGWFTVEEIKKLDGVDVYLHQVISSLNLSI